MMTLGTDVDTPAVVYRGNGLRVGFAFPFPVLAPDALDIMIDGLPCRHPYRLTGQGCPVGGAVTFVDPPPAGARVALRRRAAGGGR